MTGTIDENRFEDDLARVLGDVAMTTDVGPVPLASIKENDARRGWFRPLATAAAVLAVVGTGFAVAPLVDGDPELVVAAPGKRLAGLGAVVVEVPEQWATRATSGTSRHGGCNSDHPQESGVEYRASASFTGPIPLPRAEDDEDDEEMVFCRAMALAGDYRPDDVEVVHFSTSAPEDGDGKARTGFAPGELAGTQVDLLPAVCDRTDLSDSAYCTASARFPAADGGHDVWVTTEAWSSERATEMLSWVRIAPHQVGVPAPLDTSLETYLADLDDLGLDVKLTEHPLPRGEKPYFEPTPGPTSVLREGDVVRVDLHGIDVPDSVDPDDVVVDDSTRVVGSGHLFMEVPAKWPLQAEKCGTPTTSTVFFTASDTDVLPFCPNYPDRPADVEVVYWERVEQFGNHAGGTSRREEFLGVETVRFETTCGPHDGSGPEVCTAQVWFTGDPTKSLVTVEAPTKERAEDLIGTLHRDTSLTALPGLGASEEPEYGRYSVVTTPDAAQKFLDLLEQLELKVSSISPEGGAGWQHFERVRLSVSYTKKGKGHVELPVGTLVDPEDVQIDVSIWEEIDGHAEAQYLPRTGQ